MLLLQDFRYGLRILRRTPAFAATAVLTLGIGLGLDTALFTLFNAYVLRPLAVNNPYRLYQLGWTTRRSQQQTFSWEQYREVRSQGAAFSDAFALEPFFARVAQRNLIGNLVSGNYFSALGVDTVLGRSIREDDASTPGTDAVVVLSYSTWKAVFAGDPAILGRKISINRRSFEVIGVCREDFTGLEAVPTDLYVPITMHAAVLPGPDLFGPENPPLINILGHLAPGVSMEQAKAGLTVFATHATEQLPDAQQAIQAVLISRATALPADGKFFALFLPLMVAFVLVLVICCANVSNMMLARALGRQREMGVRLSLGAGRLRLIRQLLSENLLVALFAGVTGFAVSFVTIRGFQRVLFTTLPPSYAKVIRLLPLTADYHVFFFMLAAAAATTILFGLAPALQGTRVSLVRALHGEFGSLFTASRLRGALLVSQITVCLVLLALTGILLDGSSRYQHKDIGYNIRGIVSPFTLGGSDRNTSDRYTMVKLAHRLAFEPWVESIAGALRRPLNGSTVSMSFIPGGEAREIQANYNFVSPEYFEMLGIPILRGRNFTGDEPRSEAAVVILSQSTARRFWPNENALGKSIHLVRGTTHPPEAPRFDQAVVIGITKDVASGIIYDGIDATMLYFPGSVDGNRALALLVKGKSDTASTMRLLEPTLSEVAPDVAMTSISLEDTFATEIYPFQGASMIALALGVVSLLLSISGMYGVMSYLVGRRTKEIGVRLAVGANPARVVALILGQCSRFVAVGLLAGVALSLGTTLLLRHWLFMLNPYYLPAYAAGAAIAYAASLAAAGIPSSRAARINPVDALRAE